MNWKQLTTIDQLSEIKKISSEKPQLIFKHSTRCSISAMAKSRMDRASAPDSVDFYLLDLLKYRNISGQIETDFMVTHESPQALLIVNGECVFDESHSGISMDEITEQASKHASSN